MPRKIIWLPGAARDVARLREFIREKNPKAAQRAAERIKQAVKILIKNPEAGRPADDLPNFRDLIIPFGGGNYLLRYREDNKNIVIVRVWHSKEERV